MSEPNVTIVGLSKQDLLQLELICIDDSKDDALSFCKALRLKINQTVKGMKSHLDS